MYTKIFMLILLVVSGQVFGSRSGQEKGNRERAQKPKLGRGPTQLELADGNIVTIDPTKFEATQTEEGGYYLNPKVPDSAAPRSPTGSSKSSLLSFSSDSLGSGEASGPAEDGLDKAQVADGQTAEAVYSGTTPTSPAVGGGAALVDTIANMGTTRATSTAQPRTGSGSGPASPTATTGSSGKAPVPTTTQPKADAVEISSPEAMPGAGKPTLQRRTSTLGSTRKSQAAAEAAAEFAAGFNQLIGGAGGAISNSFLAAGESISDSTGAVLKRLNESNTNSFNSFFSVRAGLGTGAMCNVSVSNETSQLKLYTKDALTQSTLFSKIQAGTAKEYQVDQDKYIIFAPLNESADLKTSENIRPNLLKLAEHLRSKLQEPVGSKQTISFIADYETMQDILNQDLGMYPSNTSNRFAKTCKGITAIFNVQFIVTQDKDNNTEKGYKISQVDVLYLGKDATDDLAICLELLVDAIAKLMREIGYKLFAEKLLIGSESKKLDGNTGFSVARKRSNNSGSIPDAVVAVVNNIPIVDLRDGIILSKRGQLQPQYRLALGADATFWQRMSRNAGTTSDIGTYPLAQSWYADLTKDVPPAPETEAAGTPAK